MARIFTEAQLQEQNIQRYNPTAPWQKNKWGFKYNGILHSSKKNKLDIYMVHTHTELNEKSKLYNIMCE